MNRRNGTFSSWRRILMLLLLVLVTTIWLCYYTGFAFGWYHTHTHSELPCFESREKMERVRYMLSAWDEVAREENVTTWIEYGSLLGAHRYKDMIPWDHDGDFGYLYSDIGKVEARVMPKLRDRYAIALEPGGKVLRHKGAEIDVFPMATYRQLGIEGAPQGTSILWGKVALQPPPGVAERTLTRALFRHSRTMEGKYSDMEPRWLFPTRRCAFGNASLSCPAHPEAVLAKRYPHTGWLPFGFPFKLQCYAKPWNLLRIIGLAIW